MMWKIELDEDYYKIYDSKKLVAGYFGPDYGDIHPEDDMTEKITQMIKNHEKIHGGHVMIPLVRFNLFNTDLNIDINELDSQIKRVLYHITQWKDFLTKTGNKFHSIGISHTEQDMLTITFPIKFPVPVNLEESKILKEIEPTLQKLQSIGLL